MWLGTDSKSEVNMLMREEHIVINEVKHYRYPLDRAVGPFVRHNTFNIVQIYAELGERDVI